MKEVHLCNKCLNVGSFPECLPDPKKDEENVELGNGFGKDNIIECSNYSPIEMEGSYHAE